MNSTSRHLAVTLTAIACAIPIAHASPPSKPMEGCARTFAASLATPTDVANRYDIRFLNRGAVTTEADYDAGRTTYDLVATDRKTGSIVAKGQCTVDADDAVIALTTEPLSAPGPTLAAGRAPR